MPATAQEIDVDIPEVAREVTFTPARIVIDGATVFSADDLAQIYAQYIGQEVPLAVLWIVAGEITQKYLNAGYFLSRAFVPAQEIENGVATIKVVEGYIAEVSVDDTEVANRPIVRKLIARLQNERPLNAKTLESFVLRMNDLPGQAFRTVVEPLAGGASGATRLSLRALGETGTGFLSFDNFGSRFLGPYQTIATYQDSFLPLQQTTISVSVSIPPDELKYIAIRHEIPLFPDWQLDLSGSYVASRPGSSLEESELKSGSSTFGVGLTWQPIRQREKNLAVSLELSGQNTNGDVLGDTLLTKDRIRALRGRVVYEHVDRWNGYGVATVTLSQGLSVLGASKEGDENLSRAEADPNFTTARFGYVRQQAIGADWLAVGRVAGQLASGPLFSAEEFGYGGQAFGRAYDPSEITGDHGLAASLEMQYLGWNRWRELSMVPYAFYDIGKVWNEDSGGVDQSAASAGFGVRFNGRSGLSGTIGLAWPLTRPAASPLYGSGSSPRLLLQVSYRF